MLKDRERLFKRGFAEHGNAFAIRLASLNVLVISGSEHNKVMYTQTDKALNMQEGYGFLKEAVGEVLFTASKDDYYNQRPALQEISMNSCAPMVHPVTSASKSGFVTRFWAEAAVASATARRSAAIPPTRPRAAMESPLFPPPSISNRAEPSSIPHEVWRDEAVVVGGLVPASSRSAVVPSPQ
jgi:hypothetical protein